MTGYLDQSQVEIATVDYFRELGYDYAFGPDIGPEGERPEREDYGQVVLVGQSGDGVLRINEEVAE